MTYREEQILNAWKAWLLEAVRKKFEGKKISAQLLVDARAYILDLIELTFEEDTMKDWKKHIDVEVGMDEETEQPYYKIVWKDEEDE